MTSIAITAKDEEPSRIKLVLDGEWITYSGRGSKKVAKGRPWVHPSLNEWAQVSGIGGRYRVKAIKAAWDVKVAEVARGVGRIAGPVVVTVTSYIPVDRDEDIDNRTPKFILDALVDAGVIDDDGRRTVVELRTRIRVDRAAPRTEIVIATAEPTGVAMGLFPRALTRRKG